MSKLSRTKGHGYEREIASKFRDLYPDCRRKTEYHQADADGVDIQHSGVLRIQCKRGRRPASIAKIKEIKDPAGAPCLITRGDHDRDYAVIELDFFLQLLAALNARDPGAIHDEGALSRAANGGPVVWPPVAE